MKIVLDTNILVSALLTKGTPPDQLYQAWRAGKFELVTSHDQLDEFRRVLGYERLQPYIKKDEAAALLANIDALASIVDQPAEVDLSPDPDDNRIIGAAISGGASYIVTGDKGDLLALGTAGEIPIITARQAVEIVLEDLQ